ncbi:MAG: sterol desaturase family protein, partial [Pseudomonadota bacterium]
MNQNSDDAPMSREWNYHPELPLHDFSVFQWPPRPGFLLAWIARNWLTLSERVLMLLIAIGLWYLAYPPLEAARTFAIGWIAQVWLVNMAMM